MFPTTLSICPKYTSLTKYYSANLSKKTGKEKIQRQSNLSSFQIFGVHAFLIYFSPLYYWTDFAQRISNSMWIFLRFSCPSAFSFWGRNFTILFSSYHTYILAWFFVLEILISYSNEWVQIPKFEWMYVFALCIRKQKCYNFSVTENYRDIEEENLVSAKINWTWKNKIDEVLKEVMVNI